MRASLAVFLLFPLAILAAGVCRADGAATEAARQLARKLAAQIDPKQTIYIAISDLTGKLSPAEIGEALQACSNEMHAYRFRDAAADSANVSIRVTLSEDLNSRLWVADFNLDGKALVAIVQFGKSEGASSTSAGAPAVVVQAQMVYEQSGPMLDFSVTKRKGDDPAEIAVMSAEGVSLYEKTDGQWHLLKDQPFSRRGPASRDPRGMLALNSQGVGVASLLGGATCSFSARSMDSPMDCGPVGQPWAIHFSDQMTLSWNQSRGRNYFLSSDPKDESPNEFFSLDVLDVGHQNLIATTGVDGRAWIRLRKFTPQVFSKQWGSDLASGGLTCGGSPILLATSIGDYTEPDQIQAIGIGDLKAVVAGNPVSVEGPVTALWGNPARAVVHNLKTGNYEAYQITLACNH